LFNLVVEIGKKEDLRGLELEAFLGFEGGFLRFEEE
jgi:hypothetical protein